MNILLEDAQESYFKHNDLSHYIYYKNLQCGVLLLLPSVSSNFHPQGLEGKELAAFYPC